MAKVINNYLTEKSFKDSLNPFIGLIPNHWKVVPLFSIAKVKSITNCSERELLSVYLNEGIIRFTDVKAKRTNVTSLDTSNYQRVDVGDFVLNNQQAWRGSVGVSNYDGKVSPAYIVLKLSEKINKNYANYLFRNQCSVSQYLISSKGVGTIQRNLYYPFLKRMDVVLPPIPEQTAIANFLDDKTVKIDHAIAQKERMIKLLQERKQIIIQNAVTKGLNPNVKMKDSGVEWIGDIPEHWEISKLRYLGTTQNGISAGGEYFGSGHPFLTYSDVYNNIQIPESFSGLAQSSPKDQLQFSVKEGDVFFTRTSETMDEVGFSSTCFETVPNSTFAGFLIRFRPNTKKLFKGFSKYYFSSNIHRSYFTKEMNLVTRASLSQELLKSMTVLLPPLKEQENIFNHLESYCEKFNNSIRILNNQIEKLKEYKTTLIDHAVTGKIKVS